jgi:hypothetical protein
MAGSRQAPNTTAFTAIIEYMIFSASSRRKKDLRLVSTWYFLYKKFPINAVLMNPVANRTGVVVFICGWAAKKVLLKFPALVKIRRNILIGGISARIY